MTNEMNLNLEELDEVAGGGTYGPGATHDELHNLENFRNFTVCNVVRYDSSACLTMRYTPGGQIIPEVGWQNGDRILVHKGTVRDSWVFAYKKGKYGYVNKKYIR